MMATDRFLQGLGEAVPSAGFQLYRRCFGLLMFLASLRQLYYQWPQTFYLEPSFQFTYAYFHWVRPLPAPFLQGIFIATALFALGIGFGKRPRIWALFFFLTFTYIELLDKTYYLNHYYLVSLLAGLFILCPVGPKDPHMAKGWLYLFRFQVGLVYFFAGVAKINSDWLLLAEPLTIWFRQLGDAPLLGPLLVRPETAYVASWASMIFDISIPMVLCFPKLRPLGFVALVVFHLLTGWFFPLGVFPWLMILNATLFFPPHWPKKKLCLSQNIPPPRWPQRATVLFLPYLLFQCLWPLRHHLYEGNSLWHEGGFRFSWKVMLMEKTGLVTFRLVHPDGQTQLFYPHERLSPLQVKMMSTQPDMMVQFAHHIAKSYPQLKGVYATSHAALNGRRSQVFLNPQTNLLEVEPGQAYKWVMPLESEQSQKIIF